MAAQDDEDDYMSDVVLSKCEDKRPGLVYSRTTAKKYASEARHKQHNLKSKQKSTVVLETEKRFEGLQKEIGSENKGFELMKKMGYKSGESIGKSGTGRKEPVPITIKNDRHGLGRSTQMKQELDERTELRKLMAETKTKHMKMMQQEFRTNKENSLRDNLLHKDIYQSQKVCEHLDTNNSLTVPVKCFYWPNRCVTDDVTDEENEVREQSCDPDVHQSISPMEMLEDLTSYIRSNYYYCLWCGTAFDDADDLEFNCPGRTRVDHDN